jgi:type IV pilus assembly protein PilO
MNFASILERLSRIARTQRIAIYAGLVLLLGALLFSLLYLPRSSELDSLNGKRRDYKEKLAKVEVRVANRNLAKERLRQLQSDLTQALKELPNSREIPGLLKGISTTGKKVGLEVRRFTPLPEQKREYVAEVPVALEVGGSFHEVAMFFDRLSDMNRIVYVKDIEMGDPQERGGKVYLTVTGNAVTFRFLTKEEQELQDPKGKKGKRGRRGRGKSAKKGG